MAKKVTRKKSKTTLQKEIAKLKAEKQRGLKLRKELIARKKEIQEIRALQREVRDLKGVGTRRRLAGQVGKKLSKDAGRVGWKGVKIAGKFLKNVVEAESKAQARDRTKAKPKRKRK